MVPWNLIILGRHAALTKRSFDVVLATSLLVLGSPLFCVLWIAVRITHGRPAIFSQERPGRDGKIFTMYKFRTMTTVTDDSGDLLADADRLTKLGVLLRSTSLDELPELWNILKGDMSFVGPRPLLTEYLEIYTPEQMRRHEVRPGLTGLAQVSGRNAIAWEDRFAMDLQYVNTRSFQLDMQILAQTALTVIRREGISEEGQATMGKFEG